MLALALYFLFTFLMIFGLFRGYKRHEFVLSLRKMNATQLNFLYNCNTNKEIKKLVEKEIKRRSLC